MLNIPDQLNDQVVLAYAISNGYQENIITPATEETLRYNDGDPTPITVPAVPESSTPNPQCPEDFVTELLTDMMINSYKQSQISAAVAQAVQDATETATQTVEASITLAENDMAQKAQIKA